MSLDQDDHPRSQGQSYSLNPDQFLQNVWHDLDPKIFDTLMTRKRFIEKVDHKKS